MLTSALDVTMVIKEDSQGTQRAVYTKGNLFEVFGVIDVLPDPRRQPLGDVGLNPSSTMNWIHSMRQSTSYPVHGYPHPQKGI